MKPTNATEPSARDDESTGLPLFHTWPAVYLIVLASFILWVVLLIALTQIYS